MRKGPHTDFFILIECMMELRCPLCVNSVICRSQDPRFNTVGVVKMIRLLSCQNTFMTSLLTSQVPGAFKSVRNTHQIPLFLVNGGHNQSGNQVYGRERVKRDTLIHHYKDIREQVR